MKIFRLVKASLLLILCGVVVVPLWIYYFDKGHDQVSIEQLQLDDNQIKSLNLQISGKALFEDACRYETYRDNGDLDKVLWYVPFVSSKWTINQKIKSIIIFDSGKRSWDPGFDKSVKALDIKIDSLKSIEGDIFIDAVYKKYDFFKFDEQPLNCLLRTNELAYVNESDILKLESNGKESFGGKIFVTFAMIALVLIISSKIR